MLSVLAFLEGRGGGTVERDVVEPLVITLAMLETDDVLAAGFGLSVKDFFLVFGSTFTGKGGSTHSPQPGALTLGVPSSSDFVLVAVIRGSFSASVWSALILRAGRGGGGRRLGKAGGPLGKFAVTFSETVTFSLGILKDFCLINGRRSGIWGLGLNAVGSPG